MKRLWNFIKGEAKYVKDKTRAIIAFEVIWLNNLIRDKENKYNTQKIKLLKNL